MKTIDLFDSQQSHLYGAWQMNVLDNSNPFDDYNDIRTHLHHVDIILFNVTDSDANRTDKTAQVIYHHHWVNIQSLLGCDPLWNTSA